MRNLAEDARVKEARTEVQKAFENYNVNTSSEAQQQLQSKKEELKQAYNEIQEEELDEMIGRVEDASARNKHGESWRLINSITGRKSAKRGIIKGNSREDRIKKWYNHFHNLLGKVPDIEQGDVDLVNILHDLQIDDVDFTLKEMAKVKKQLREGKGSGSDNIPPEVLKRCNLDDILLNFANKLLNDNEKPKQWSEIDMIPLPKTGDLSDTGNYRGISLSSIVAQFVNKMILNRIQPKLDQHLRPNQNGFRPGRSTTAHILALRRLIEGV